MGSEEDGDSIVETGVAVKPDSFDLRHRFEVF
jgi:hypothetical protein